MKRRVFRRRRRRLPETYTIRNCHTCYDMFGSTTCAVPLTDMQLLLSMSTPRSPGDPTELTSGAEKFIVFDGMKFQNEWSYDNSLDRTCFCPNPSFPNANAIQTVLTIWEALMIVPFVQGSQSIPAYLPNLTSGSLQAGDVADRVLWKRISKLRIHGQASLPGTTIAWVDETTDRVGHGPVAVKTRARLDDRHGLYMVRNFVHDVFWPFAAIGAALGCGGFDCDECGTGCNNDTRACGVLPIFNDFWGKLFYHSRK